MTGHQSTADDFPEAKRLLKTHQRVAPGDIALYDGIELELDPGVLSPFLTRTTTFFAEHICLEDGATVAEVGVGSGFNLVFQGLRYRELRLLGSDVNPAAVNLTRRNLTRHGLQGLIVEGSLFEGIPDSRLDFILFNPPLLVVAGDAPQDHLLERAIFDYNGEAIGGFFEVAPERMHTHSVIYIIYTNRQNCDRQCIPSERIVNLASKAGLICSLVTSLDAGYEVYGVYALRKTSASRRATPT